MISYCIPVCNEHIELNLLLTQIKKYLKEDDEIIIQGDQGNVTSEVVSVINNHMRKRDLIYVEYPLNGDFATYKNNLLKYATKPWIFQIDADELVSEYLLENIHSILEANPVIEVFAVPRVNLVKGLTPDWIKKWGWNISKIRVSNEDESTINILNEYGITGKNLDLVNFPDYQCRVFKNNIGISWKNKVHEVLVKSAEQPVLAQLPHIQSPYNYHFDYSLFHIKNIERQIKQNQLYDTIKP